MRKNKLLKFTNALMAVAMLGTFASCDSDDDPKPNPDKPTVSYGMYVVNNGNLRNKIKGDITYYDYASGKATQDMFAKANGRSLGDTPQTAVAYGSKIYVGVYQSNVIDVLDRNTFKSIKQIKLEGRTASQPRDMVARDGSVYVSMYTGWVSRLDTVSCELADSVKVGPNPELMAIHNNKLYVPNSDGMNWQNGYGTTASEIDLSTFKVTKTFDVPLNPKKFMACGDGLYLLSMGDYGDVKSAVYKLDSDLKSTEIAKASIASVSKSSLYLINAPYSGAEITYQVYDVNSGKLSNMLADVKDAVDYPAGLEVDPISGDIFITSYVYDGGKVGYSLPGYCKIYGSNGVYKSRFETGVGPTFLFPSTGSKTPSHKNL